MADLMTGSWQPICFEPELLPMKHGDHDSSHTNSIVFVNELDPHFRELKPRVTQLSEPLKKALQKFRG